MRVPEIVYRLARAPSSSGPLFELFSKTEFLSAQATSLDVDINGPPKDKVLILTNIAIDMNPATGQAVSLFSVTAFTPSALGFAVVRDAFATSNSLRRGHNWQGEVAIGGGGIDQRIVNFNVVFSSPTLANATRIGLFGYVIPRGNIAPF